MSKRSRAAARHVLEHAQMGFRKFNWDVQELNEAHYYYHQWDYKKAGNILHDLVLRIMSKHEHYEEDQDGERQQEDQDEQQQKEEVEFEDLFGETNEAVPEDPRDENGYLIR